MRKRWAILILCCCPVILCAAVTDLTVFPQPQQQARFVRLTQELRCLVCQNQDLADSQAPLAVDLRERIANAIRQGQSDAEIKRYLVARYGEFILYQPAVHGVTYVLWLGPALMLLLLLSVAYLVTRRRVAPVLDAQQQARAKALLASEDDCA